MHVLVLAWGVALAPRVAHARSGPEGLEVGKVEVVGLGKELESFPRDRLALSPRRKMLGTERTLLTKRTLDEDRERIRIYLVRLGYPDVAVTAAATPDRGGKRAQVVFTVVPGTRVRYGAVSVTGMPPSLEKKAREQLAEAAPSGEGFDQGRLETLRGELRDMVREAGHARADVDVKVQRNADTADVAYTVTAGPSYVFGDVTVLGVKPDLTSLATRVIGTRPGEPATAARLKDVNLDLRKLNLFRKIEITTQPVEPDTLDLTAQLSLQAMTTWEVSVGTFTDEWLVGSVAWTHRNLLGHGRSFHAETKASQHEVEGLTRVSWPALILRRSRTDLTVSYDVAMEENYQQRTAEAEIADSFDPWRRTTARVGFAISRDDVDDDPASTSTAPGWTPMLRARVYRDASNNLIEPAAGSRLGVTTEWSPPVELSDNPFFSVYGNGSWYRSPAEGTILASRFDVGMAQPLGSATGLLPSNRYFAGGSTSMRGYERHRLGPVDSGNEPVGGEVVLLAGVGLRQAVTKVLNVPLGLSLFVDSGQVWANHNDVRLDEIKVALGGGVLIGTPLGPIRLETAGNVGTPMHGDDRFEFHFAIGHPY